MEETPQASGRGHGKLILFGEHAVVYGKPAIAAGLPRGARATASIRESAPSRLTLRDAAAQIVQADVAPDPKGERVERAFAAILEAFEVDIPVDIEVTVEVPVGVGLGSSAALAVAVARALGDLVDRPDRVEEAVEASERIFHGTPSGIDQLAASEGGLFFFSRGESIESAPIESPPLTLTVCKAGPAAATSEMVERVAGFKEREPQPADYLTLLIGDIARSAADALESGDLARLGELMDVNHGALSALGVTTAELDAACHTARSAGALGAKLTGAGGGGCVVALTPDDPEGILAAWHNEGWDAFSVTIATSET